MNNINDDIEKFDIFEVAKKPECVSILKMVLENLPIYNLHVDSQDEEGNTLLHHTVTHQDYKTVQQVLSLKPSLSITNHCQETPLYCACNSENLPVAKLLLQKGADINTKDSKSRSLLHLAVEKNNVDFCKYLINLGIKLNSQDVNGSTPLHYAVEVNQKNIAILLAKKANINKQDFDGYTPLHVAAETSGDIVKLLLLRNASFSARTHHGDLPLHLAASSGNYRALTVLLNRETKLNSLNNSNYTPLQLAEMNGHKAIVELLSDYGNAPNFGPPSKIPKAAKTGKLTGNLSSARRSILSMTKLRTNMAPHRLSYCPPDGRNAKPGFDSTARF